MGLLRKRKNVEGRDGTSDTMATTSSPLDEELMNGQVQEVMKDNLELMKDVVMRIREEPEFAKSIYKNCPRLQHLLDQYPDLRPIFEDPKLVRINFEQVYRDAGGVLPEDEEKAKKKSCLVWLVNSPIFKVLKALLFIKKLMACIAGGGLAFITGCLMGCCFEDALEELDGDNADNADGDADDGDGDMEEQMDPNKEALNRAADHMEDPEVQEHMQKLLDNPDGLDEAIENDSELRALRDSNPLCEELMGDPDTMRILTDPDNLRALGEAPDLIEADFIDPEGFVPTDIETGGGGGDAFEGIDGGMDQDFDLDLDMDADANDDGFGNHDDDFEAEGEEGEEEEEDEGWWEEAELEEQDSPDNDQQGGAKGGQKGQAKAQPKQQAKQAAQQQGADGAAKQGRFGGIMASIGVAATDLIASQIVGNVFGDGLIPGGMGGGGGGDLDGIDGADVDVANGDDLGDAMDDAGINDIADDAGEVINDDVAGVAEDTMDEVDEKAEDSKDGGNDNDAAATDIDPDAPDTDKDGKKGGAVAGGVAGGAVAGGATGAALSGSKDRSALGGEEDGEELEEGEDTFDDEEEVAAPKQTKLGWMKNMVSAVATATKEHITTSLLGDDFGEEVVEWQEEEKEEEEKDEDKKEGEEGDEDGDDKKEDGEEEKKKKKRGMFGRKKKD